MVTDMITHFRGHQQDNITGKNRHHDDVSWLCNSTCPEFCLCHPAPETEIQHRSDAAQSQLNQ